MKLQDSKVNCGPTALANALKALGHSRSVEELSKLCKTSATNGTSPRNLVQAVEHLKESCDLGNHEIIRESKGTAAIGLLIHALLSGRTAVVLVDAGEHYVAAVAMLGQYVLVVDSADEGVVQVLDRDELLARWEGPGRFAYWGVVL